MSKADIGRERLSHFLVVGALQTVVISDGVNPASIRGKCKFDALADLQGLFSFRCSQTRILSFALHKSGNNALMACTDDRIAFPVSDAGFIVNDSWVFINADAVGDTSPAVLFAIAFVTFFLATQVFMEIATLVLILVNMKVNPFVADSRCLVF